MRGRIVGMLLGLLGVPLSLSAQGPRVVTGRVTAGGAPQAAVVIRIERLGIGAVTREDGRFRLVIPPGMAAGDSVRVTAARIGFRTQSRTVALRGDTTVVDFGMEADAVSLGAIVATSTGVERRAAGVRVRGAGSVGRDGGPGSSEPGVLTAGILDDFSYAGWRAYQRFLREHRQDQAWRMDPGAVVRIRVRANGRPLRDHPVALQQGDRRWELRTRADGTIRVFPRLLGLGEGEITVTPRGGAARRVALTPGRLRRGMVTVDGGVAPVRDRPLLDIGLLIDATGSMQDEMTYLQTELRDIVSRVQPEGSPLRVRITVVYYRDRGDEFITRAHRFDPDVDSTLAFLGATPANGGGDFPEEMNEGLRVMMEQSWSETPAARMLFVVADAPPHFYADERYTYHDAVAEAGRRGISIFPVASSGVDRPTEYLMRAMAVATGGKYLFLTDDSGVGNPHLTPEEPFDVHRLNDLMVREIRAFVAGYYPDLRRFASRSAVVRHADGNAGGELDR